MARFWVIGGEYRDTRFAEFAPGAREERLGPFATYDDAFAVWRERARATIDDATVRYRVIAEEGHELPSRPVPATRE